MKTGEDFKKIGFLILPTIILGAYFGIANLLQWFAYEMVPQWVHFEPTKPQMISLYLNGVEITISILLLLIVWIGYRLMRGKQGTQKCKVSQKEFIKCVIYGIAITGFTFLLSILFSANEYADTRSFNLERFLMLFLTSVIFAPLIEEMLFRGIIYNLVRRWKEGWIAVIISAIIFGAYHMDWLQGIYTFFLGGLLAFVYWKTKNIKYPILIHAVNNAFVCMVGTLVPVAARPICNWASVIFLIPAGFLLTQTVRGSKQQN